MISEFERALVAIRTMPITVVRRLLAAGWIAYRTRDHEDELTRLELRLALRLGQISASTILEASEAT